MGINFMLVLYKDRFVLIHRHMLPSPQFKNSARQVPVFDNNRSAKDQEAQNSIGEFALIGKMMTCTEWGKTLRIEHLKF